MRASGVKLNPGILTSILLAISRLLVKAALLYFGAKTGYRILDETSDAIADMIGVILRRMFGIEQHAATTPAKSRK